MEFTAIGIKSCHPTVFCCNFKINNIYEKRQLIMLEDHIVVIMGHLLKTTIIEPN